MSKTVQTVSKSQKDTQNIARKIASCFHPGDLIILDGDLGAGKTHFVKGFTESFFSEDLVTSPTFSIANFYRAGKFNVLHIDLYRIETIQEFEDLGIRDYFDTSIVLIEWGKKFEDYFDEYMLVSFETKGDNERLITFTGMGEKYDAYIEIVLQGIKNKQNKLC